MDAFILDTRVWPGVIVLLALLLLARIFRSRFFSYIIFTLLIFHMSFFRDFSPKVPAGDSIVSPASGKVVLIDTVSESRFLKEEAWRIRIFLALWNVHVTRSPMNGEVLYQDHVPGEHVNALFTDSLEDNESNWIGIRQDGREALVRQMTGAIARRIYSDVSIGDKVTRGAKLGIICYGSTVELFIPKRLFAPSIKSGQRVRVGETVLGTWREIDRQ